jgi:hypothetical protein
MSCPYSLVRQHLCSTSSEKKEEEENRDRRRLENTFTNGQNDLKMLKEKKDWKSLHNFNVEKDIYQKKKKKKNVEKDKQ